jgi:Ca2+/Na+ antiporter
MSNKAAQQCVWECRRTKIELEHEVLLREMEAALIGLIGIPIAVVTIAFQVEVWQNQAALLTLAFIAIVLSILLDSFRSDRKEKIVAKQKELDDLITELTANS